MVQILRKFAILLLLVSPCWAQSPACPQILLTNINCHTLTGGGTGTTCTTYPIDTTGATQIVIGMVAYNSGANTNTVSSSPSNSWTPLTNWGNTQFFYATAPTTGTTQTFTCNNGPSGNRFVCFVLVYSGVGDFDAGTDNGADSYPTPVLSLATGPITPAQKYDLILSLGETRGGPSLTADSGLGTKDSYNLSFGYTGSIASLTDSSASPINVTWSDGGSYAMGVSIAGFVPLLPGSYSGCPATTSSRVRIF